MIKTVKTLRTLSVLAFATALLVPVAQAGHGHKQMTSSKNIVETAAEAGQFETLIAAAKAAGLAGALSGDGPLTVFAPTDDAFAALPAGTVESLLKPENKAQLARILKYHVVAGRVGSEALADGVAVETLAGDSARFSATEGGFSIENARIVATDRDASNGVVHVIDRVILPPEQVSSMTPEQLIRMAINEGAPMYNHGNAQATVALYTLTAHSLMSLADLDESQKQRLAQGIREADAAGSARDGAWKLRYALDDVQAAMQDERRMASR